MRNLLLVSSVPVLKILNPNTAHDHNTSLFTLNFVTFQLPVESEIYYVETNIKTKLVALLFGFALRFNACQVHFMPLNTDFTVIIL